MKTNLQRAQLTESEISALKGLDKSYVDMDKRLAKKAPKCHFRTMSLEQADDGCSSVQYWECSVCGHVKHAH